MSAENDLEAIKRDLKELDEMLSELPTKEDWLRGVAVSCAVAVCFAVLFLAGVGLSVVLGQ